MSETDKPVEDKTKDEPVALTLEAVKELLKEQLDGADTKMNNAVTGATNRMVDKKFDEQKVFIDETIKKAIEAANAEPAKDPSEVESLKSQVETLSTQVNKESEGRIEAEKKSLNQALKNGINSVLNELDGKDGRPNLRKDAREGFYGLISGGYHLDSEPRLSDDGQVVVEDKQGEIKPLSEILINGYFKKDPWAVEKYEKTGSGSRTNTQQADIPDATDWTDAKQVAELAKNPAEFAKRSAARTSASISKLGS